LGTLRLCDAKVYKAYDVPFFVGSMQFLTFAFVLLLSSSYIIMKSTLITLLGSLSIVPISGYGIRRSNLIWAPAGPDDVRGPCPMLNTLANHNILPHDGKSITLPLTIAALAQGVNFTPELATFLFNFAQTTNPNSSAMSFDLDHLGRHGILEHDASLSRTDSFLDPSDEFNAEIFNETTSHWTSETINLSIAASSRLARAETSVKTNPVFTFNGLSLGFAYGEVAAYLLVFGDRIAGTAPRNLVTSFFENERLPTDIGWVRPAEPISPLVLCEMSQRVINATGTTLEQAKTVLPCSDFGVEE